MFFRMLKSDIRHNKGLNVILFIFITVASLIVFIGGGLLYANLTDERRVKEASEPSDIFFLTAARGYNKEEKEEVKLTESEKKAAFERAEEFVSGYEGVVEPVFSEVISVEPEDISADAFDEDLTNENHYYLYLFSKLPERYDKLYNEFDEPFTVEKGSVMLPLELRRSFGFEKGDIISVKAKDGTAFDFEIAGFYKDPFFSTYSVELMIVCGEDYEMLGGAFDDKELFIRTKLEDESFEQQYDRLTDMYNDMEGTENIEVKIAAMNGTNEMSEDSIVNFIISVFMIVIVLFLILIIFMITRFTMISDLKKEEKEIGVIKAIGSDTAGFRWLYSAKYCAFAAVGSVAAAIAGVPLYYRVSRIFNRNSVSPKKDEILAAGSVTELLLVGVIMLFAFLMMKRINRISVVDALQGENHGERFGKGSVLYLYKSKKMPLPVFWVLSDILKRFKRYLFLIVAYTLGMSIMLLCFNLRNTVISSEFLKYVNIEQMDFWVSIDEATAKQLIKESNDQGISVGAVINKRFEENGIPAQLCSAHSTEGKLHLEGGRELKYQLYFDLDAPEDLTLREGVLPKLENEIVLNYYFAHNAGLKVGDVVDFSILEHYPPAEGEEKGEEKWVDKKLVITGFRDGMESGGTLAVMGEEYTQEYCTWTTVTATKIFSDDKDKVIAQMRELMPGCYFQDGDEMAKESLRDFDVIFENIEYIIGSVVLVICALMTYLFETIFLTEERSEIALMKSMGFSESRLKAFQLLRIAALALFSQVLALAVFKTLGVLLMRLLFSFLYLSGFTFLPEYLFTMLIIPTMMFTVIILTTLSIMGSIDRIAIRDITEE